MPPIVLLRARHQMINARLSLAQRDGPRRIGADQVARRPRCPSAPCREMPIPQVARDDVAAPRPRAADRVAVGRRKSHAVAGVAQGRVSRRRRCRSSCPRRRCPTLAVVDGDAVAVVARDHVARAGVRRAADRVAGRAGSTSMPAALPRPPCRSRRCRSSCPRPGCRSPLPRFRTPSVCCPRSRCPRRRRSRRSCYWSPRMRCRRRCQRCRCHRAPRCRRVGADQVAFDQVAGRAAACDLDAVVSVAGDDVAGPVRRPADRVTVAPSRSRRR